MRRLTFLLVLGLAIGGLQAADCSQQIAAAGFPQKLKLGKKPTHARWPQVDRALADLREALQGSPCQVRFKEVFAANKSDFFFPISNSLLATVAEESLVGAGIYSQDGSHMGEFSNRVPLERNGSILYYFQFEDSAGRLQASKNGLQIDTETRRTFFQLKWSEILDRFLFGESAETD